MYPDGEFGDEALPEVDRVGDLDLAGRHREHPGIADGQYARPFGERRHAGTQRVEITQPHQRTSLLAVRPNSMSRTICSDPPSPSDLVKVSCSG